MTKNISADNAAAVDASCGGGVVVTGELVLFFQTDLLNN